MPEPHAAHSGSQLTFTLGRKIKFMRIILFVAVLFFPGTVKADGTLFLSDIEPLLNQQPALWHAIKEGFDLRNVGLAPRIGLKQNKELHGSRIAPYTFDAKPKGSSGAYIFTVTIEAKTHYFNKKGKEVALMGAWDFKEELQSISIMQRPQSEIDAELKFETENSQQNKKKE